MNVTLYGLDKSGGYKIWSVRVLNHHGHAEIIVSHGKDGGKITDKVTVIKEGKNIGRSNETTPYEQALSEAESKVNKQKDKGYRESKKELTSVGIAAMLSQDYNKKPKLIKFPCLVSRKLDGCRALAIKENGSVTLQSRGNKEYTIPHIQDALNVFMEDGDILDGELFIQGKQLQEIMSAVKKPNEFTPDIKFLVFDTVVKRPYHSRYDLICNILQGVPQTFPADIQLVEHYLCVSEAEMLEYHKHFVGEGYEGCMLRNLNGMYESGKRSNDLSKFKTFLDEEFQIVGVQEDKNNNAIFELWDSIANDTFTCTFGDFNERKYQLNHPEEFIGKWLTVQYQARYLDTLKCQFPSGKGIREGSVINGKFLPDK